MYSSGIARIRFDGSGFAAAKLANCTPITGESNSTARRADADNGFLFINYPHLWFGKLFLVAAGDFLLLKNQYPDAIVIAATAIVA